MKGPSLYIRLKWVCLIEAISLSEYNQLIDEIRWFILPDNGFNCANRLPEQFNTRELQIIKYILTVKAYNLILVNYNQKAM